MPPRQPVCEVVTELIGPWPAMPGTAVGDPAEPAAAYVLVTVAGRPFLRIDVHPPAEEYHLRTEAEAWEGWIAVGFAARVVLVSPAGDDIRTIGLSDRDPPFFADYYCGLTPGPDFLLVCSGTRVFRIGPDGKIHWKSPELGFDGVLISSISESVIEGDGECDPPGGWRPFTISLETGGLIEGGPDFQEAGVPAVPPLG